MPIIPIRPTDDEPEDDNPAPDDDRPAPDDESERSPPATADVAL